MKYNAHKRYSGSWQKVLEKTRNYNLIKQLQNGTAEWAYKLPISGDNGIPEPPESFYQFTENVLNKGVTQATESMFEENIITPPAQVSSYFSGNQDKAVKFSNAETSIFMVKLFHYIKNASPVNVKLCGWDFYHCHYFIVGKTELQDVVEEDSNNNSSITTTISEEGDDQIPLDAELVMLFHAKEFPKEFRSSKYSIIHPIGSPHMRGGLDPRFGSEISVHDGDYHLRNYLYLLSTNSVYLCDPKHLSFPTESLQMDTEFYTLSEYHFTGFPLGNINYFPNLYLKDRDKITEIDENGQEYTYFKDNFIAASENVLASPVHLSSILNLKNQLFKVYSMVRAMNFEELEELFGDLEQIPVLPVSDIQLNQQLTPSDLLSLPQSLNFMKSLIGLRKDMLSSSLIPHNNGELERMIANGFSQEHAEVALKLTADKDGKFSSFRGEILATIVHPEYRDDELLKISKDEFEIHDALVVSKIAFYADSSLEALCYSQSTQTDLVTSARLIVKKRHEELAEMQKKALLEVQEKLAAKRNSVPNHIHKSEQQNEIRSKSCQFDVENRNVDCVPPSSQIVV